VKRGSLKRIDLGGDGEREAIIDFPASPATYPAENYATGENTEKQLHHLGGDLRLTFFSTGVLDFFLRWTVTERLEEPVWWPLPMAYPDGDIELTVFETPQVSPFKSLPFRSILGFGFSIQFSPKNWVFFCR